MPKPTATRAIVPPNTSPLEVFLKLLAVMFAAEAGVMIVLPKLLPSAANAGVEAMVDSCLLTLVAGPLIWWVVIGPLRWAAANEKLAVVAQMAAGVAHELRNPLTSVKLLVQSHRQTVEPDSALAEDLQIVEDEIRRMERSLQAFLDFARPRAPERQWVDPAAPANQVLSLIKPRAQNQSVRLQLTQPSSPVTVHADPECLVQVLLNLCSNSLDAMPRGGEMEIRIEPTEDKVRISVRDTGPGIAPEIRPRLFQPFVTSKATGVGLGLVNCRRIAEAHGGSILVESGDGGANFVLELPRTPLKNT
ncbi:MAG: HAMP domain-containing histidine kinase [Planctomycetales bacterium]|nr:HAMP domain-containing histidine kinase [Planctomycetales bacterium]